MTKEELKELGLEDEAITTIFKNFVPKGQFNKVNDENKAMKEDIKALKENSENSAELKEAMTKLQKDAKEREEAYTKEVEQLKLDNALTLAIKNAGAKGEKAMRAYLDLEKIKLEDGKLVGAEEQIEALKTAEAWLFTNNTPQVEGVKPATPPADKPEGVTREKFNKMTYTEKAELFEKDPELFKEFTE